MASFVYNEAAKEIMDGTIDLVNDTIEVMLVNSSYSTVDRDNKFVDEAGSDALTGEIVATNYTGGHAGSGRKATASDAIVVDDANDRAEYDIADITWTALGNGSNDTIVAAVLIKRGATNDTDARLIAYLDIVDTTTNGGDFTLVFDAQGLIQLGTT